MNYGHPLSPEEARESLLAGKRLTKMSWFGKQVFIQRRTSTMERMAHDYIYMFTESSEWVYWQMTQVDYLYTQWYLYNGS